MKWNFLRAGKEDTVIKQAFARSAACIMIFTIVTRVVGFVYRIYLSNVLGPEGMGIYQIVFAVFAVLITLTSSGIPVTVSRQSAIHFEHKNTASAERTVTAAALVGLVTAGAIRLVIVLFRNQLRWLFADARCMPIFLCLIPAFLFSSVYSACRGGLWGEKSFFLYSLTEFIEELLLVIAGFILLQFAQGIFSGAFFASLAVCISYCLAAVITFLLYVRRRKFFRRPKGFILPLVKSSAPLTGIRLCSNVLNSLIAIILPMRLCLTGLTTPEALAQFGIMSGMTLPLLFLPDTFVSSVALLLVPELSADHAKNNPQFRQKAEFALSFALAVALMCIPVFAANGRYLSEFLYSGNQQAGVYLEQCCYVMIFMCLSLISNTVLNSMGLEYKTLKNFLAGAVCLLACIWILPRYCGIYALMIGYAANLGVSSVLNLFTLRKYAKISFRILLPLLGYAALLVPATLISRFTANILHAYLPLAVAVILSCGITLALSGGLALLFGFIDPAKLGFRLPDKWMKRRLRRGEKRAAAHAVRHPGRPLPERAERSGEASATTPRAPSRSERQRRAAQTVSAPAAPLPKPVGSPRHRIVKVSH